MNNFTIKNTSISGQSLSTQGLQFSPISLSLIPINNDILIWDGTLGEWVTTPIPVPTPEGVTTISNAPGAGETLVINTDPHNPLIKTLNGTDGINISSTADTVTVGLDNTTDVDQFVPSYGNLSATSGTVAIIIPQINSRYIRIGNTVVLYGSVSISYQNLSQVSQVTFQVNIAPTTTIINATDFYPT